MLHVILADHYPQGREYAKARLGLSMKDIALARGVVVLFHDSQVGRILSLSRDRSQVRIHDLAPLSSMPTIRAHLHAKGLL